jgi:Collagen triple helix repeat (20 copies)
MITYEPRAAATVLGFRAFHGPRTRLPRLPRWPFLAALCTALIASVLMAVVPSVASADISTSGTPIITTGYGSSAPATLQVGQMLMCNISGVAFADPGHDGTGVGVTGFNWYHQGSPASVGNAQQYMPQASDIGSHLVCTVTGTEFGVANSTIQSAPSAPSPSVTPVPALTLTQYSPTVTGNAGESTSGVSVSLTLVRGASTIGTIAGGTTVGTALATTNSSGDWAATLTSAIGPPTDAAFGVVFDELLVHYSGSGTLPPDVTYSLIGAYNSVQFLGDSSTISADGGTVSLPNPGQGCAGEGVLVNGGAPQGTSSGANNRCVYTPATALTDRDHVQARFAYTYSSSTGGSGVTSSLTTVSDVGLLGVGASEASGVPAPTCTVDLVSGQVVCSDLNAGTFSVTNNGGTPVVLATQQTSRGQNGYVGAYQGTGSLPGVKSGDLVTLDETRPVTTTRHLTKVNVFNLRVDNGPAGTSAGDCQPGKSVGVPPGYGAPMGVVCPAAGTFTGMSNYGAVLGEVDDLSGGRTIVQVPSLSNTIPSAYDSIAGGSFTAYGDLVGTGSTTQVLSQVASVNLRIVPHAGGAAVFDHTMTPDSDSVGPFETSIVNGLSIGRYIANFTLTDSHTDTNAIEYPFAVQPGGSQGDVGAQGGQGSQGPQGPQGPQGQTGATGASGATGSQGPPGPQGLRGPTGKSSKCTVTSRTVGTGKSKHTVQHIRCVFISPARDVMTVTISRGPTKYATATALVHPGRVDMRLRSLRPIKHGRYLITIVALDHRHATVTRFMARI